jgi:hypothetical protein
VDLQQAGKKELARQNDLPSSYQGTNTIYFAFISPLSHSNIVYKAYLTIFPCSKAVNASPRLALSPQVQYSTAFSIFNQ